MVIYLAVSSVNRLLGRLEDTNFLAFFNLEANAVCLVGLTVENGDVRDVQRRLLLDDTALNAGHRVRLGMALHEIDPTNDPPVVREDLQHLTALENGRASGRERGCQDV